jgi:hypothetical protein
MQHSKTDARWMTKARCATRHRTMNFESLEFSALWDDSEKHANDDALIRWYCIDPLRPPRLSVTRRQPEKRSIDNVSCLRHSRRTGQGEKPAAAGYLGLDLERGVCRNVIAQRQKSVRIAR